MAVEGDLRSVPAGDLRAERRQDRLRPDRPRERHRGARRARRQPRQAAVVTKSQITNRATSTVSMMPEGLYESPRSTQIADLLAFVHGAAAGEVDITSAELPAGRLRCILPLKKSRIRRRVARAVHGPAASVAAGAAAVGRAGAGSAVSAGLAVRAAARLQDRARHARRQERVLHRRHLRPAGAAGGVAEQLRQRQLAARAARREQRRHLRGREDRREQAEHVPRAVLREPRRRCTRTAAARCRAIRRRRRSRGAAAAGPRRGSPARRAGGQPAAAAAAAAAESGAGARHPRASTSSRTPTATT